MYLPGVPIINGFRLAATAVLFSAFAVCADAHHGGTFDNTKTIELTGTLTRIELINPHSWIYFDAAGPDGNVRAYRSEMRSATKGAPLWHDRLHTSMTNGPITYQIDRTQNIVVGAGDALYAFTLRP